MELFELVKLLNSAHGPSGDEGNVRDLIASYAAPYADGIFGDTMGNLIVRKKGNGPRVMFAAHMDSIGFIVTHIEKEGYLRVGRLGGITPTDVSYIPVRFKNGVKGVLAPEAKADFGKLKLDDCYIDIGAKDEEEAKSLVRVGDTAVYDTTVIRRGDKVVSPYLDNRISCAILLKALEAPIRQIATNAGLEGSVIVDKIVNSGKANYGFDFYNETFVDMLEAGIVDPTKVTRSALQNAASVASMVLTTESLVADKKEDAAAANAAAAAAASAGGMY